VRRSATHAAVHAGRGEGNTGAGERRRRSCLPLVGAGAESVDRPEIRNQDQSVLIEEKQNTNNEAPEGLPLVGLVSSEFHRKERRETTHVFSDFMIILRLENALQTDKMNRLSLPRHGEQQEEDEACFGRQKPLRVLDPAGGRRSCYRRRDS
jgi:hypothetical protein